MARAVQVLPVSDWRGGLNYNADAFQLGENEVSDALNVDFDPSGGFARRKHVAAINSTALSATPKNLWTYFSADGSTTKQLLAQVASDVYISTGGNFSARAAGAGTAPFNVTTTGAMRAATAGNRNYIQRNAEQLPVRWDGTTATALVDPAVGPTYNDNFASPNGGDMPKAKYLCVHRNHLFHGNLVENATARYSRVRYSHPSPDAAVTLGWEDYRTNDYIDVDPGDGDVITGIVSWKGRLVIFKNNSVHQLSGYDSDTFQVDNISKTVGAIGQEAIAVGDEGVYFFSWPNGLQLFDGKSIRDLWYPMTPVSRGTGTRIDGDIISTAALSAITVGYVDQRVWLSVPCYAATNDRTFVYDPQLGKTGGWTRYTLELGAYTTWHPPGADRVYYAVKANGGASGYVLQLLAGDSTDTLSYSGATPVTTAVASAVWTRFYDLGNPALIKRWKHPIFVCDADNDMTLPVTVFTDYDFYSPVKAFSLTLTSPDAGALWDVDLWDVGTWGGGAAGPQVIEKGATVGRGTAIALHVRGPVLGNLPWSVNSITFKYLPRRIRA